MSADRELTYSLATALPHQKQARSTVESVMTSNLVRALAAWHVRIGHRFSPPDLNPLLADYMDRPQHMGRLYRIKFLEELEAVEKERWALSLTDFQTRQKERKEELWQRLKETQV